MYLVNFKYSSSFGCTYKEEKNFAPEGSGLVLFSGFSDIFSVLTDDELEASFARLSLTSFLDEDGISVHTVEMFFALGAGETSPATLLRLIISFRFEF